MREQRRRIMDEDEKRPGSPSYSDEVKKLIASFDGSSPTRYSTFSARAASARYGSGTRSRRS
jgi:hypothetical protein